MDKIESLKKQIIENLNIEQLKAVEENEHSTRIIAGPGTGKTTTLISKVLFLIIYKKINPKNILIITFTNKAKEEIEERIKKIIPDLEFNEGLPIIFTYHSFASNFLRRELKKVDSNWENFKIIDSTDQLRIFKKIIKENNYKIKAKELVASLDSFKSLFKNNLINLSEEQKIISNYEEFKKENYAFDFNDLIFKANEILESNEEIKSKWRSFFDYILVDEFQDTDNEQFELLKLISKPETIVSVVGDPDQNLYSWRGSNIKLILNFDNYFKNSKTFYLVQNYRSTPEILNVALDTIRKNKDRIDHDLYTKNKSGNLVNLYKFDSNIEEARFVVEKIKTLIKENNFSYKDFAIIYRANYISQEFETSLINENIPYKVIGGFKFYDRKEIKETLNFIAFLLTKDNYYFEQVINIPKKGLGPTSLQKIIDYSFLNQISNYESLKILFKTNDKINHFINEIDNLNIESTDKYNFKNKILNFLEKINYLEVYKDDQSKLENIKELINQLYKNINFESFLLFKNSFFDFLQKTSLFTASDVSFGDVITLITVHSAKGTEFKNVFIVGMNDGIFPSYRAINSKNFEEERRAFYVAITRAKENLFISYFNGRDFSGNFYDKSRFLDGLSLNLISSKAKSNFIKYNKYQNEIETKAEDYYADNSSISTGNKILHNEYGVGIVIEDMDKYIKVAFSKKYGLKILIKNNKAISKYE